MTNQISEFKPVYRTITVAWLKKQGACDSGIALFRHMVGGDRATIRFCGADLKWMHDNFWRDKPYTDSSMKDFAIPGLGEISRSEMYLHVNWLYDGIRWKCPELDSDCYKHLPEES